MTATIRNNVKTSGAGARVMLFAHGFGCDQSMWRHVAPRFERDHTVVALDLMGAGGSDLSAYDPARHGTLAGHAADIVDVGRELGIEGGIFVGHSVSAMIGVLASIEAPGMFDTLILVGPSPRYLDDADYSGGFSAEDMDDLLAALETNPLLWSTAMAPQIMGNADRPQLGQELTESFCRMDPAIGPAFARVTFTSDNRADLPKVTARTLILQCRDDIIANETVGEYVHDHIAGSELVLLDATGHCPNLSAPEAVVAAIRAFLK